MVQKTALSSRTSAFQGSRHVHILTIKQTAKIRVKKKKKDTELFIRTERNIKTNGANQFLLKQNLFFQIQNTKKELSIYKSANTLNHNWSYHKTQKRYFVSKALTAYNFISYGLVCESSVMYKKQIIVYQKICCTWLAYIRIQLHCGTNCIHHYFLGIIWIERGKGEAYFNKKKK